MEFPFVRGLRKSWPAIRSSELCGRALLRAGAMEDILHSGPTVVGSERRRAEGVGNAPISAQCRSCFRDKCSQLLSACLPEMLRLNPSHALARNPLSAAKRERDEKQE